MSGIAGAMFTAGATEGDMLGVLQVGLAPRGPDGDGRFVTGGLVLAHSRLAHDPAWDDQPLFGPDGLVAVCDGQFAAEGAGGPDAALARFRGDPLRFAGALSGHFALALFDPAERTLLLARDTLGVRPLYYAENAAGLVFASTAALARTGARLTRALGEHAAQELLQLQFLTGRQTGFAGVARVLPGESLLVRGGRVVDRRRRAALPSLGPLRLSETEALARLDTALGDALAMQATRGDRALALRASPGTAALLAACVRHRIPVRAVCAAVPARADTAFVPAAATAARLLGADLILERVDAARILALLPRLVAATDDPVADYGAIPAAIRAIAAGEAGAATFISDDGADELFAAHGRYRSVLRPVWRGGRAMRMRGFLDGLGVLREEGPRWRDGIQSAERRLAEEPFSRLQRAQAIDCADWLPHDVLLRLDRVAAMASVTPAAPFVQEDVAALGFRLPELLKIAHGRGAVLLNRYAAGTLGADAGGLQRGEVAWLRAFLPEVAGRLGPAIARVPAVAAVCHPGRVRWLFQRARLWPPKQVLNACWQLLYFALWTRIHLDGADADAEIFEILEGAP